MAPPAASRDPPIFRGIYLAKEEGCANVSCVLSGMVSSTGLLPCGLCWTEGSVCSLGQSVICHFHLSLPALQIRVILPKFKESYYEKATVANLAQQGSVAIEIAPVFKSDRAGAPREGPREGHAGWGM